MAGRTCVNSDSFVRVALIHPDIAGNTGNIGRLCVGLDIELHLVRPLGFVLDDKKIRRSGLDYWPHLKLHVHDGLDEFMRTFSSSRMFFFSTKAEAVYTQIRFQSGDMIVFGAESTGLPLKLLQAYPGQVFRLPMPGPVRSLNVASCVAVMAFEAHRQLHAV